MILVSKLKCLLSRFDGLLLEWRCSVIELCSIGEFLIFAETLWHRKRYFRHLHDRNENIKRADERAACNAPIQGSAADLIKLAMINLDKELQFANLKAKLILQVHDELVLEVPDEEVDRVKEVIDRAMTTGHNLKVPLKVDMSAAKNWMDCK